MIGWIIGWIVTGAILGYLARLILPGRDPMSFLSTVAIGILGALLGGVIFGTILGVGYGWIAELVITVGLVYVSRRTGFL
ncbi:MAG: GlsB/YeaQ/YmgE family stress response membrane protein, partial [Acidimicrobiaceae bacterium]|nr:GlsB/YeaQ/YmgE family stress response membrane protein [Acidimicrobiaceae bacterium]